MRGLASVENVPQEAALVVSRHLATLYELQTIYSWNDMLDLVEIAMTDNYNEWCAYNTDKQ